jgi:hypothetical protein
MTLRDVDPSQSPTQTRDDSDRHDHGWTAHETKASFKTTELWAAIVGVVALIVVYNASSDLSLDLFRACLLCTVLGAAYIVSRGIAKSGSRPEHADWDAPSKSSRRY